MKTLSAFVLGAVALLVASCGHTNELARYAMDSKPVLYEQRVSGDISRVAINYSAESDESRGEEEEEISTLETLGGLAGSIGTAILTAKTREKLHNAAQPDNVAAAVSHGVEHTMERYLRTRTAAVNEAEFIVLTTLEDVALVSWSGGIALKVKATTAINERGSGALVWENCESHSIPLRRYLTGSNATGLGKTLNDVGQAIILAQVSERELTQAIEGAAGEVGRLMAETLREDIIKARR